MNTNATPCASDHLSYLQSQIKFDSPQFFTIYLSEIYSDLLNRVQSPNPKTPPIGITMRVFFNYFNIQTFIGERMFISMDKDDDGFINQVEFINGFLSLYQSDLNETCKFFFKMYDFNKDKVIFKHDVQLLLSQLPMTESWENQIKQIDEIGEELLSLSSSHESIEFNEYFNIISTKKCKHMIKLLNYFWAVRPFTVEEVNMFKLKRSKISLKTSLSKQAALPIRSPEKRTAAFNLNKECDSFTLQLIKSDVKDKDNSIDVNNSNGNGVKSDLAEDKDVDSEEVFKKEKEKEKEKEKKNTKPFEESPAMRKTKQSMSSKALTTIKRSSVSFSSVAQEVLKTPLKMNLLGTSSKSKQSIEREQSPFVNKINHNRKQSFNDFQKTSYSGKFTKLLSSSTTSSSKISKKANPLHPEEVQLSEFVISDNEEQQKLEDWVFKYEDNSKIPSFKKYYAMLIGRSLFFFLTSSKNDLLFIYSLSSTFLKGDACVTINKANYYPITINYNTTRYNQKVLYFVMDSTRKTWLHKLKTTIKNFDINDYYTLSDQLGEGRFGIVKRGVHLKTNKKVAVKVISKQLLKDKDYELIMKELTIMKMVNHPSLVGLIDYYENDVSIYLVMELLEGGDLIELLQQRKRELTEKEAARIIKTIALGIQYMNRFGLMHRDLKPENIILGKKGDMNSARIIDYGLTRTKTYGEIITDPMGTILYVAPEVLRRKPYDYQVDIWSIGVILYFLLGGLLPFDDEDTSESVIGKKIVYSEHEYPKENFGSRSKGSIALIDKCLTKNPSKRITINEFLQDNWLLSYVN